MCALAWIMVFEHSSGSMMLGADWLSLLGSATDSRPEEDGDAATTLFVLCLDKLGLGMRLTVLLLIYLC